MSGTTAHDSSNIASALARNHAEPIKPYQQILVEEIVSGVHELERPPLGLLLSGLSAGLDIGFSIFLGAVVWSLAHGHVSELVLRLLLANTYTVGFIFVILGRSELFTEHTTLAILPLISRKSSVASVGRLWGIVYAANLMAAAIFATLAAYIGPGIRVIDPAAFGEMAHDDFAQASHAIFLSGMLAGWLMGLMSWLVAASRDTISQVVIVWLVAFVIGLTRLHHAIVGSVTMLAAVFAGQGVTWGNYGHFLLWATLGNVVGGGVFVSLLKYGHATRSGDRPARKGKRT